MPSIRALWRTFSEQRLVAMMAAIVSILTSSATLVVSEVIKAQMARGEARYARDVGAAQAFREDATAMESLVATYISLIIDNEASSEARRQLEINLQRQNQRISELRSRDPTLQLMAGQYENALIELDNVLSRSGDVLSMREFWEKTSRLIVLRNQIFDVLRSKYS